MIVNIRAGDVPDLIRKTAEEFCGAFYEGSRTERFRRVGVSQKAFIRRHWGDYVEPAVEVLSAMLGMPGTPEREKQEIYDAIVSFRMVAQETTPGLSMRSLN